jgi:GMP synthase (glutamine-hydrolysing)
MTTPRLRYLLLQTRNADDAMRGQEVRCFARRLACEPEDIAVVDLLARGPMPNELQQSDMVLLGGSGHYSAAGEGDWLERALDALRMIHQRAKPTFASCWGFQAMARALGGRCVNDPDFAELGTVDLCLSAAGRTDLVFGGLPVKFCGLAGHEDHVVELPPDAELLASTERVRNQAFRFKDKPIYCTQFHPELDRESLVERVAAYPVYIDRIAGVSHEELIAGCRDTPEANTLLRRFVKVVFGK